MTDIIRKATIVLGLETGDVKIEVPDLGPVLKAREKEAELIEKVASAEKKAHESEAKRVEAIEKVVQKKDKATKGLLDDIVKLEAEFDKKFDDFDQGLKDIVEEEKKFVANTINSANQFFGATEQMAEGVFLLSRSVALLSADSEEDLQAMLKNLAKVQGAFDLFKGATQAVRGLKEGIMALELAVVGLHTALGPVGLVFAGVALAVGALGIAYRKSTKDIDDNTDAIEKNRRTQENLQNTWKSARDARLSLSGLSDQDIRLKNKRAMFESQVREVGRTFDLDTAEQETRAKQVLDEQHLLLDADALRRELESAKETAESERAAAQRTLDGNAGKDDPFGLNGISAENTNAQAIVDGANSKLLEISGELAGVLETVRDRLVILNLDMQDATDGAHAQ